MSSLTSSWYAVLFEKMPNRTALIYDENAIAHATINGHVYGFASPGAIAKNEGLLVRKDWLDNLGLEVPRMEMAGMTHMVMVHS